MAEDAYFVPSRRFLCRYNIIVSSPGPALRLLAPCSDMSAPWSISHAPSGLRRSSELIGRLEVYRNRYRVHDDRRTVIGQRVVQDRRNDVPIDGQRYVVRPVGVKRKYRHLLSAIFGAIRRFFSAPFLARRVVIGQVLTAVLGAEPLFDVCLELVHGPVGRIRVRRERHATSVR